MWYLTHRGCVTGCLVLYREPVLEKASVAAWGIILDKEGVGKEIVEKVDAVYARLSGNDSSASSPQYNVPPQFQERPGVDARPMADPLIPSSSANGNTARVPPNHVYSNQGYNNPRTPVDRGNTPRSDVSGTPIRRPTDRGSTPRTDYSGPQSSRRGAREEYYHAPAYEWWRYVLMQLSLECFMGGDDAFVHWRIRYLTIKVHQ